MPGKRRNSLELRIQARIQRDPDAVFIRADFDDLEAEYDYDQIGRALRKLVRSGDLLKAGYGLYMKSRISPLSGRVVPAIGIREMTEQVFKKIGVAIEPTEMEQRYNEDLSTQVPTGRVVRVKGRTTRRIQYGQTVISYEYA